MASHLHGWSDHTDMFHYLQNDTINCNYNTIHFHISPNSLLLFVSSNDNFDHRPLAFPHRQLAYELFSLTLSLSFNPAELSTLQLNQRVEACNHSAMPPPSSQRHRCSRGDTTSWFIKGELKEILIHALTTSSFPSNEIFKIYTDRSI